MTTNAPPHVRPEPLGGYAYARRAGGLLFISGMGPRRAGSPDIPGVVRDASGAIASYDIEVQAHACFENVRACLEAEGSSLDHVVDVLAFLVDLRRDFQGWNRVWAARFPDPRRAPTRTTIEVSRLPQGGSTPIHIELKVVAAIA